MSKIKLMDGADGTTFWEHTTDRRPVWLYNMEMPDFVKKYNRLFADQGTCMVLTNTFAANRLNVSKSKYTVEEIVSTAVRLNKEALKGTDALTALSIGPISQMLEPFGPLTYDECRNQYEEIISAGMSEHADIIYFLTFLDLEMMKVAVSVAKQYHVPIFCSFTFTEFEHTLMGNSPADIVAELEPMGIDAVGMNCTLPPDQALPVIKQYREATTLPTLYRPNAGKPITAQLNDGNDGGYSYPLDKYVEDYIPALPYVDYAGGCCGCNEKYIQGIKGIVDKWNAEH